MGSKLAVLGLCKGCRASSMPCWGWGVGANRRTAQQQKHRKLLWGSGVWGVGLCECQEWLGKRERSYRMLCRRQGRIGVGMKEAIKAAEIR